MGHYGCGSRAPGSLDRRDRAVVPLVSDQGVPTTRVEQVFALRRLGGNYGRWGFSFRTPYKSARSAVRAGCMCRGNYLRPPFVDATRCCFSRVDKYCEELGSTVIVVPWSKRGTEAHTSIH